MTVWRSDDRVAHRLAAQVEHAVAQAQRSSTGAVLVDRERRRLGLGEPLDVATPTARSRPWRCFGLTLPSSRRTTSPATRDHVLGAQPLGERVRLAARSRGGRRAAGCPVRSRRSMKISPPWSRRRCTQPATRTVSPARRGVELAGPGVAVAGWRAAASQRRLGCGASPCSAPPSAALPSPCPSATSPRRRGWQRSGRPRGRPA